MMLDFIYHTSLPIFFTNNNIFKNMQLSFFSTCLTATSLGKRFQTAKWVQKLGAVFAAFRALS